MTFIYILYFICIVVYCAVLKRRLERSNRKCTLLINTVSRASRHTIKKNKRKRERKDTPLIAAVKPVDRHTRPKKDQWVNMGGGGGGPPTAS